MRCLTAIALCGLMAFSTASAQTTSPGADSPGASPSSSPAPAGTGAPGTANPAVPSPGSEANPGTLTAPLPSTGSDTARTRTTRRPSAASRGASSAQPSAEDEEIRRRNERINRTVLRSICSGC
jgi:hypothetical protein